MNHPNTIAEEKPIQRFLRLFGWMLSGLLLCWGGSFGLMTALAPPRGAVSYAEVSIFAVVALLAWSLVPIAFSISRAGLAVTRGAGILLSLTILLPEALLHLAVAWMLLGLGVEMPHPRRGPQPSDPSLVAAFALPWFPLLGFILCLAWLFVVEPHLVGKLKPPEVKAERHGHKF